MLKVYFRYNILPQSIVFYPYYLKIFDEMYIFENSIETIIR